MKIKITFEIIEDGDKALIYSIRLPDEDLNEFVKFSDKYSKEFPKEYRNIETTLDNVANRLGVRDIFFKPESYKKSVDRLKLTHKKNDELYPLRLYCLRYGTRSFVIIGGGAKKERPDEKYQDNPDSYNAIKILEQINDYIVENAISPEIDSELMLKLEIEVDL